MANVLEHVPVSINWKEVFKMEADAVKTYQQMLVCEQKLAEIGSIPLASFQESDLVDPGSFRKVVHSLQWQVNAVKYRTLLGQKALYDEVLNLIAVAEETKTEVGAVKELVDKVKTSVDLIEKRLEVLEKRMSTMDDRMSTMDARMSTMDARMANMEKVLKAMDCKMEMLEKKVGALDKKVDALDKKVDALDKKVDALDKKVDAMDGKLDHVLKEVPNWIRETVETTLKNMGLGKIQSPERGGAKVDDAEMRTP